MSISALAIAISILTILVVILYLREYWYRHKLIIKDRKFLEENGEKSFLFTEQAMKKAQDILEEAELESIKLVHERRSQLDAITKKYAEDLSSFFNILKSRAEQADLTNQEAVENRINQLFEQFETRLTDHLLKIEQQSTTSVEAEISSIRTLIDGYKQQQLQLIDENIIAMLEKTLSLVIPKKLTLKDQLDLVNEALEKAKAEKFIV